jgi:hypothetical protein
MSSRLGLFGSGSFGGLAVICALLQARELFNCSVIDVMKRKFMMSRIKSTNLLDFF